MNSLTSGQTLQEGLFFGTCTACGGVGDLELTVGCMLAACFRCRDIPPFKRGAKSLLTQYNSAIRSMNI